MRVIIFSDTYSKNENKMEEDPYLLNNPSVSRQSGLDRNLMHCRMMGGAKKPSSASMLLLLCSLIHSRVAPNCCVGVRTWLAAAEEEADEEPDGCDDRRLTSLASCLFERGVGGERDD